MPPQRGFGLAAGKSGQFGDPLDGAGRKEMVFKKPHALIDRFEKAAGLGLEGERDRLSVPLLQGR